MLCQPRGRAADGAGISSTVRSQQRHGSCSRPGAGDPDLQAHLAAARVLWRRQPRAALAPLADGEDRGGEGAAAASKLEGMGEVLVIVGAWVRSKGEGPGGEGKGTRFFRISGCCQLSATCVLFGMLGCCCMVM